MDRIFSNCYGILEIPPSNLHGWLSPAEIVFGRHLAVPGTFVPTKISLSQMNEFPNLYLGHTKTSTRKQSESQIVSSNTS